MPFRSRLVRISNQYKKHRSEIFSAPAGRPTTAPFRAWATRWVDTLLRLQGLGHDVTRSPT